MPIQLPQWVWLIRIFDSGNFVPWIFGTIYSIEAFTFWCWSSFLSLVVTTPLMWHLMKRVPLTTLYPGVDWSRLVVCVTISLMHTCIIVYFGSMSTSYWSIPQELQRYNFLSEKCLKSSETTHGDMCPCRTFPCFCVAYSRRTFDDV